MTNRPLADQLRPTSLDDVVGQDHLIGEGKPLSDMLKSGVLSSLIFWGPPGCGKTTLARLLSKDNDRPFVTLSAIGSGVADLRKVFAEAEKQYSQGKQTVLFVDEIHRFNRAQQDSFLPLVENGTIILVGATTENPSFELNSALLSRASVFVLKRLDENALNDLILRAEKALGRTLPLEDSARQALCHMADGDGRSLLNMIEVLSSYRQEPKFDVERLRQVLQKRAPVYDKSQEGHYNLISALHKSLRGSDVDAALYWFCRMLDGGEDPLYIARRLVRFASEDIGLADPHALTQANEAVVAYQSLGTPEGELALAQAVVYLATAPKSNAVYTAYKQAMASAKEKGSLMPPDIILNAPTKLMKQQGYGKGYIYDHDTPEGFSGQDYFPKNMQRERYYFPVERGFERDLSKRLKYWHTLRKKKSTT